MLLKIIFLFFAIAIKQSLPSKFFKMILQGEKCTIFFTEFGISFNRYAGKLENMYNVSKLRLQYQIKYAVFCGDTSADDQNESNQTIQTDKSARLIINGNSFICNFENVSPEDDSAKELLIEDNNQPKNIIDAKLYPISYNTRYGYVKVKEDLCQNKNNKPYKYYLWPVNRDEKGKALSDQIVFLFRNSARFGVNNPKKNTDLYIKLDIKDEKIDEPKKVLVKKTKKL